MLRFGGQLRVFVYREAVSMKYSFSGLSVLVESVLMEDPLSGHLFVFVNRRRDYLKVLYWERGGYCLWSKRLEAGTYRVPDKDGTKAELTVTELEMMLAGFELSNYRRRRRYEREKSLQEKELQN